MRTKAIIVLIAMLFAVFNVSLSHSQVRRPTTAPVASLKFTVQNGDICEATVAEIASPPEHRRIAVSCNSREIFDYVTPDHLLDISRDSSDGNRLFTRWEGTTLVHLVVFRVEVNQISSKVQIVFDQSGEFTTDIPSSDVLLVHKDKRFVGADIIPTRTDVYAWNGSNYELQSSWKWNENMRYEDRFCILDVKSLSCPVTPIPIK